MTRTNCCRCGRGFAGLVDANACSTIARDMLATHAGQLPRERVRFVCWQCSDALAALDASARDKAIREIPYPEIVA